MEIKITSLGLSDSFEIGMDQYKYIYKKPKDNDSWEVVYEYRRKPKTRKTSWCKDMTLLTESGLFSFAVDEDGKYWKKYKNNPCKEMIYEDQPKYELTCKIISTSRQCYWTEEYKTKIIIKRYCNLPLI